uniref:C2H2-type domain-containing protein n=1 Tax=Macrostomum lignano TaxID=282301 RepID=A0A1I8F5G2_9PLAT
MANAAATARLSGGREFTRGEEAPHTLRLPSIDSAGRLLTGEPDDLAGAVQLSTKRPQERRTERGGEAEPAQQKEAGKPIFQSSRRSSRCFSRLKLRKETDRQPARREVGVQKEKQGHQDFGDCAGKFILAMAASILHHQPDVGRLLKEFRPSRSRWLNLANTTAHQRDKPYRCSCCGGRFTPRQLMLNVSRLHIRSRHHGNLSYLLACKQEAGQEQASQTRGQNRSCRRRLSSSLALLRHLGHPYRLTRELLGTDGQSGAKLERYAHSKAARLQCATETKPTMTRASSSRGLQRATACGSRAAAASQAVEENRKTSTGACRAAAGRRWRRLLAFGLLHDCPRRRWRRC